MKFALELVLRLSELLHALGQAPGEFRQALGSEEDEHDDAFICLRL